MPRFLPAVLLSLMLGASDAIAAGYDDFANGMTAVADGDNDRAISLFTSALVAGDLNANIVPVAYFQRGVAHFQKKQCAEAIADFSAAVNLKANYLSAFLSRSYAEQCVGNDASAVADLDRVVALRSNAGGYWERGRARWNMGNFAGAAEDFQHSIALERHSKDTYIMLWLIMTQSRQGTLDKKALGGTLADLDLDDWPGPLLGLFLGETTPEEAFAAVKKGDIDSETLADRTCEAQFYIGEWRILRGDMDAARPLIASAGSTCPRDFVELEAAKHELARLKGTK